MNHNQSFFKRLIIFSFLLILTFSPLAVMAEGETFTITYKEQANATVVLDPAGVEAVEDDTHTYTYEVGEDVTVTVTAADGYYLSSVKANNINLPVPGDKTTLEWIFTANTSLSITVKEKEPPVAETVDITINEGEHFTYELIGAEDNKAKVGEQVTLNLSLEEGYIIKKATYNDEEITLSDNSYTFTVEQQNVFVITVDEEQAPPEIYTLTVTVDGEGSVTPNEGEFEEGSSVTLTFAPVAGHVLSALTINGASIPLSQVSSNRYTLKIEQDTTVFATFVKTVTLSVSVGNGGQVFINDVRITTPSIKVQEGSDVKVRVSANLGYTVDLVKLADTVVALDNSNTFIITSINTDQRITASFKSTVTKQFTISAGAGANGVISPSGDNIVEEGKDITFTVTPDNGYEVDSVKVDGVVVTLIGGQYTFTGVAANQNILATFKLAEGGGGGIITPEDIDWTPSTINIDITKNTKVSAEVFDKISQEGKDKKFIFASANYRWILPKGAQLSIASDHADLALIFDGGSRYSEIRAYLFERIENLNYTLLTYDNSIEFPEGTSLAVKVGTGFKNQEVQHLLYDPVGKKLTGPLSGEGEELYDVREVENDGWVTIPYYNHSDIVLCEVLDSYYTIISSAGTGGTINPLGNRRVSTGGSAFFVVTADEGYVINTLLIDGNSVSDASGKATYEKEFETVVASHTIHATFVKEGDYKPNNVLEENNSSLIVTLIIIFVAIAGAALLFIVKWRQERY